MLALFRFGAWLPLDGTLWRVAARIPYWPRLDHRRVTGTTGRHSVPRDVVPGDVVPVGAVPGDIVPTGGVPRDIVPGDVIPGEAVPDEVVPGHALPDQVEPILETPRDPQKGRSAPDKGLSVDQWVDRAREAVGLVQA